MKPGIELLDEIEGTGDPAASGDTVQYKSRGFLNRGDRAWEVTHNVTTLGKRDVIAGVEYSLIGMRVGGYRKVKVSPHLAYRDIGVSDRIPPKAVLIVELLDGEDSV